MPDLPLDLLVTRNNFPLKRMPAITKNVLARHHYIAHRCPGKREDEHRKQVFRRMPRDGGIVQVNGKEIRDAARLQVSARNSQRACPMQRGAFQQPLGQRLSRNVIQNAALLLLKPQMVFKLPRVLQRIDPNIRRTLATRAAVTRGARWGCSPT